MKSIDNNNFINREEKEPKFPDDINNLLRTYYMLGPENIRKYARMSL